MDRQIAPRHEVLLDPRDKEQRQADLQRALELVTTDYITSLSKYDILPVPAALQKQLAAPEQAMRLYRLNKAVYAPKEDFLQKVSTVLYTAYAQDTPVDVIVSSDGIRTEYYIGVQLTTRNDSSQGKTLQEAFCGNFTGSELTLCGGETVRAFSGQFADPENIAVISGLPALRGEEKFSIEGFVQGIENMVDSLRGCSYTLLIKADPVQRDVLLEIKRAYEDIYSQLSSFGKTSFSFSQTDTDSFSDAQGVTDTHTEGTSDSVAVSDSHTENESSTHTVNHDERGQAAVKIKGSLTAAGAAIGAGLGMIGGPIGAAVIGAVGASLGGMVGGAASKAVTPFIDNTSDSTTRGSSDTHGVTNTRGSNRSDAKAVSQTQTVSESTANGRTIQFTYEDRRISDTLKTIEENIKRLDQCAGFGAFASAVYVVSNRQAVCTRAASVYNALMRGDKSSLQATQINSWQGAPAKQLGNYLRGFVHPQFRYPLGGVMAEVTPAMLVSGKELALQIGLPKRSFPGVMVMQHAEFDCNPPQNGDLRLGQLYRRGRLDSQYQVGLSAASLTAHTFVTGSTGAGKSNTIYHLLDSLTAENDDVHFLVVEPAKGEYKSAFGGRADVSVYGTNPQKTPLLRINPFSFPVGEIHVLEHLDRLVEIFNVCWPMYAAMPAILKDACERAYRAAGWDLAESVNRYDSRLFPTFTDILEQIKIVVNETEYSADTGGDYKGALVTRVKSLTTGINGQIFTPDALPDEKLFDENVIVDLSRVGSTETKALLMGLLVMKLQEHRMAMQTGTDSALHHVTVLEEAHNLLKRTSTEQSSDSANLLGKSVEMLGNAIAEMRTYGEGFIIADQAPGLMDMAVIRNTNTKIIMRLPDQGDRELVGKAAGLDDDQIKELAKLPMGVAAVYQNEWLAPVLCKVDHFKDKQPYTNGADGAIMMIDQTYFTENILGILADDHLPEQTEAFRQQVINAAISASLKCRILQYMEAKEDDDPAAAKALRMKIAASFFHAGEHLAAFIKDGGNDAAQLEAYLKELLANELLDFDELTQRRILTLIVEGARENDIQYTELADRWREAVLHKEVIE